MRLLLCYPLLLLGQPAEELRFRKLDKGQVEIVARLPQSLGKMPAGKITADVGEEWLRLCLVDPKTNKPGPPMLGAYERRGHELVLRPSVSLEKGQLYRAFLGPADRPVTTLDYRVPAPAGRE